MILALSNTNRMQEEMNSVIATVKKFIAEMEPSILPFMALVTIKNNTKVKTTTTEATALLETIEKITASNDKNPETSAKALELAIKYLEDNGVILLSTEA